MIKKFLLIGLFIALLLPIKTALGAVSYSRSPAGYTISSPVSFEVSFDSYSETGCPAEREYWGVDIYNIEAGSFYSQSPHIASTTLNQTFILDLPVNVYNQVYFACFEYEIDENMSDGEGLEGNGENPIFEVVEAGGVPTGSFLTLPTSTIADLQAQIGQLVNDSSLIWILAIALPLGFWIIYRIIDTGSKGGKKKRD